MLRRVGNREEIVLLDHGLYTHLDDRLRYHYSLLWKSIMEQDEKNLEIAASGLGAEKDYKLFSTMITAKPYE